MPVANINHFSTALAGPKLPNFSAQPETLFSILMHRAGQASPPCAGQKTDVGRARELKSKDSEPSPAACVNTLAVIPAMADPVEPDAEIGPQKQPQLAAAFTSFPSSSA